MTSRARHMCSDRVIRRFSFVTSELDISWDFSISLDFNIKDLVILELAPSRLVELQTLTIP